jgi:hypothetical protein
VWAGDKDCGDYQHVRAHPSSEDTRHRDPLARHPVAKAVGGRYGGDDPGWEVGGGG